MVHLRLGQGRDLPQPIKGRASVTQEIEQQVESQKDGEQLENPAAKQRSAARREPRAYVLDRLRKIQLIDPWPEHRERFVTLQRSAPLARRNLVLQGDRA